MPNYQFWNNCRVVLIEGKGGLGKTRLLKEVGGCKVLIKKVARNVNGTFAVSAGVRK